MLFDCKLFDHSFAIVRHPEARLLSAFSHNRNLRIIPWHMGFEQVLRSIEKGDPSFHLLTDNHFAKMVDFISQDDSVFKLESDEARLIQWLDSIAGDSAPPRALPHANSSLGRYLPSKSRFKNKIKQLIQPQVPQIDEHLSKRIFELFQYDYEAFGYRPTYLQN